MLHGAHGSGTVPHATSSPGTPSADGYCPFVYPRLPAYSIIIHVPYSVAHPSRRMGHADAVPRLVPYQRLRQTTELPCEGPPSWPLKSLSRPSRAYLLTHASGAQAGCTYTTKPKPLRGSSLQSSRSLHTRSVDLLAPAWRLAVSSPAIATLALRPRPSCTPQPWTHRPHIGSPG